MLERYHSQESHRRGGGRPQPADGPVLGGLAPLELGESDDELQYRDQAVEALRRYHARVGARLEPRWVERKFDFQIGPHHLPGQKVDRVDELPDGGYELIDYKTGDPRPQQALESDIQLAIYRLAARAGLAPGRQLDGQLLVRARRREGRRRRAPATTSSASSPPCSRSARASSARTSSPASPEICSWCDFRLICPASEA